MLCGAATLAVFGPREWVEREAHAKSGMESRYRYDQTWNSALRLVRVDLGLKILEKDEKAGYILFEYLDKGTVSTKRVCTKCIRAGRVIRPTKRKPFQMPSI